MKRILLAAAVFAAISPAISQDANPTGYDLPWTMNVRGGSYDGRFSTQGNLFVPLTEGDDSLFYLNTGLTGEDGDRQYYSLGFGFREIKDDGSIIGLGIFYDRAELGDGNHFDQLGLSFERLSWGLDFRLNGYLSSDQTYLTGGLVGYGDLFAEDFGIRQTTFLQGSEAYDGAEFEFARKLKLPEDVPFWLEVSAGGYLYNSKSMGNLAGYQAGLEVGLTEHISVEANYYDDEELLGSNTYVGIRASFALGKAAGAPSIRSSHYSSRNPTDVLRERMRSEEVRRHARVLHTEVVSDSILIADDMIFVNEGDAVGNGIGKADGGGAGSADNPFESVQSGADLAAAKNRQTGRVWTVYTQGIEDREYNEDVKISSSTRFTSSAIPIRGRAGFSFGNGVRPVIDGGFQAANIDYVEIEGYDIKDGGRTALPGAGDHSALDNDFAMGVGDGIYLENVAEAVIKNNIIRESKNFGIAVIGTGATTKLTVIDNIVKESDEHGLAVFGQGGWRGLATILRNQFEKNEGDGLHIEADGAFWSGTVADNIARENMGDGMQFDFANNFNGTVTGNESINNGDEGFQFEIAGNFGGTLEENVSSGNAGDGIALEIGGQMIGGSISGNTAKNNTAAGLKLEIGDNVEGGARINSNTLTGNGEEGLLVEIDKDFEGSQMNGNTISNNGTTGTFSGFLFTADDVKDGSSISNNVARGNSDHGMKLELDGNLEGASMINGNTTTENAGDGMHIEVDEQIDASSISGNIVSNNTGDGIDIEVGDKVNDGSSFSNNTVTGNGEIGLTLDIDSGGGDFEGSQLNGNTVNNNGTTGSFSGIVVLADEFQDGSSIDGNTVNGNSDHGIDLDFDGDISSGPNSISSNITSGNIGDGLHIRIANGKVDDGLAINFNTASNNGSDGIDLALDDDFEGSTINGNTANGNGKDGIVVNLDDNDFEDGSEFQNNTTNNNGDDGVDSDVNEGAGILDAGNTQAGNGDDPRDDNGTDDLGNNTPNN